MHVSYMHVLYRAHVKHWYAVLQKWEYYLQAHAAFWCEAIASNVWHCCSSTLCWQLWNVHEDAILPAPEQIMKYMCTAAYHHQSLVRLGLSCVMLTLKAPVMMAAGLKNYLSLCYFHKPLSLLLQSLHVSSAVCTYINFFTFAQGYMVSCKAFSHYVSTQLCV